MERRVFRCGDSRVGIIATGRLGDEQRNGAVLVAVGPDAIMR